MSAAALGAVLIGSATALPVSTQLLLVAGSPVLAGLLGVVLLQDSARAGNAEEQRLR